jgi:hypothetical protein
MVKFFLGCALTVAALVCTGSVKLDAVNLDSVTTAANRAVASACKAGK